MRSRTTKPAFNNVVDLGLRDVGVENDLARQGAYAGRAALKSVGLFLVSLIAAGAIAVQTGAAWVVFPLSIVSMIGMFVMLKRAAQRAPVIVVKVTEQGTNQVTWLVIGPILACAALAAVAALGGSPLLVPVAIPGLVMAALVWRSRGRIPELLRAVRSLLAADEVVLGDGIGVVQGARPRRDGFRAVVVTDRRLLVVPAAEAVPLVDVPHSQVARFGIEWQQWGRAGELSLTLAGAGDDGPAEALVISSIVPANLVSIAQALRSHGVQADDPATVAEAERGWEEARRPDEPQERERVLDRTAMSTREFNRGLWLFLRLTAATLYINSFGIGLGVSRNVGVAALLVVPLICGICGYVAGTKASLVYLVPLNLLVSPAFFFAPAGDVIVLMVIMSAAAALGLYAGSALKRAQISSGSAPEPTVSSRPGAERGSLRYSLSGRGLIRLTGIALAVLVGLVMVGSAAGLDAATLRVAVDQLTGKQLPVDGRSDLTGNAASLTYTPGPDLHELITDHPPEADPTDGLRWELRTSFTKGYNVVSLAHYVPERRLDDAGAVAEFLADKDAEHSALAGTPVTHTERKVDGRKAYVWNHGSVDGYWYYAAWFVQPAHTVRVECIAKNQRERFQRLCEEGMRSLEFMR